MVSEERRAWMEWCWDNETSDPESYEWRKELNSDEAAMVVSWDEEYVSNVGRLAEDILALSEGR
mgnify:CR=1 FL=1